MKEISLLVFSLLMILLSAEVFTNSVESLGRKLSLSQAVVGSILAAVGTAMPETVLPLVAILMYGGDAAKNIGVGVILGAPFMLSTIAFFLISVSVFIGFLRKKRRFALHVEIHSVRKDLVFFIIMYGAAIVLPLFLQKGHIYIAAGLFIGYCIYTYMTFKGESADMMHGDELYLKRLIRGCVNFIAGRSIAGRQSQLASSPPPARATGLPLIFFQVFGALALMVGGAHVFIGSLEKISCSLGVNPMLFALLIAPVATELPEIFNSVSWTLKGRDTLALGNVTGAMVFQSTFPVSLGLIFTDWSISGFALLSAGLALLSSFIVIADMHIRKRLSPFTVLAGGFFYALYITFVLSG